MPVNRELLADLAHQMADSVKLLRDAEQAEDNDIDSSLERIGTILSTVDKFAQLDERGVWTSFDNHYRDRAREIGMPDYGDNAPGPGDYTHFRQYAEERPYINYLAVQAAQSAHDMKEATEQSDDIIDLSLKRINLISEAVATRARADNNALSQFSQSYAKRANKLNASENANLAAYAAAAGDLQPIPES